MKYILTISGGVLACYGFYEMVVHSVTWMMHPAILFGALLMAAGLIIDAATNY